MDEVAETLFDPDVYLVKEVVAEDVEGVTRPRPSDNWLRKMGTQALADHIWVSEAWVRKYAADVGGVKDKYGYWSFNESAIARAWELKRHQAMSIGMRNEVVFRCKECGDEQVVQKGLMRRVLHEVKYCLVCRMDLPEAPFEVEDWDADRSYEAGLRSAVEAEAVRRGEVRL